MTAHDVKLQLASSQLTPDSALPLVEEVLATSPSAELWILPGDLIQLAEARRYELEEVAKSYEAAKVLAPENSEPFEELGHFYDAVMPEPERAKEYYRAALERGAGEACVRALAGLQSEDDG
jgi:hypothetical protein